MGQWSDLLPDLLTIIHEHLELYPHKIVFTCVCKHWQSTSQEGLPDLRQPQPPWLLLPYESGTLCGLYHPLEKKLYQIDLPEAGEKVFKGSAYGWVVTAQEDGSINAVNPLTRVRVPLPPRYEFPDVIEYSPDKPGEEYILSDIPDQDQDPDPDDHDTYDSLHVRNHLTNKIALSSSPCLPDCIAVAHYYSVRLAYCKIGDKKWRAFDDDTYGKYSDVTFWGGKLYALTTEKELKVCHDIASCPKLTTCVPTPASRDFLHHQHLINSSGGLMAVRRKYTGGSNIQGIPRATFYLGQDFDTVYTTDFNLYKLDMSRSRWIRMKRSGDEVLFMGLGTQLGISSKQFRGSKGNQIYFGNHQFNLKHINDCFDNGIFNFGDRSIKPLGYEGSVPKICLSPVWVIPNPY